MIRLPNRETGLLRPVLVLLFLIGLLLAIGGQEAGAAPGRAPTTAAAGC
jgi:hypothetical protein